MPVLSRGSLQVENNPTSRALCVVMENVIKTVSMKKLVVTGLSTAAVCIGTLIGYSLWLACQPQVQAARVSLEILQRDGLEYDRLADRLHQLRLAAYEREFGHPARLRLEAEERALGIVPVDERGK